MLRRHHTTTPTRCNDTQKVGLNCLYQVYITVYNKLNLQCVHYATPYKSVPWGCTPLFRDLLLEYDILRIRCTRLYCIVLELLKYTESYLVNSSWDLGLAVGGIYWYTTGPDCTLWLRINIIVISVVMYIMNTSILVVGITINCAPEKNSEI